MAKLKKIYIDASPLAADKVTGIPHFTAELIRGLEQDPGNGKDFELILVIPFDKKQKLQRWNYQQVRYKTLPLPMRVFNALWKWKLLPPVDLLLGKGIYLFPNYKNWPLHASRSLTYIHDLTYLHYPQFVQPKNLAYLQHNIASWIARSDLVLTGSDYTSQEVVDSLHLPADKVVTIYHGVDHHEYYPHKPADIAKLQRSYGIAGDYILYVGSLEPRKNLIRLVNAYCALPSTLRDQYALCLVGGGGWLNEDILQTIQSRQDEGFRIIRPNHYVDDADLPVLVSGAAVLVHPALYEGFGLPPLQAMASGVPVIVGNNSSLPEVVGTAGLLVNAEDERDISDKMKKVLTDKTLYQTLRTKGIQQANKFTWGISAQKLIACFDEKSSHHG